MMIQEISPNNFDNHYCNTTPSTNDILMCFSNNNLLCRIDNENIKLPCIKDVKTDNKRFTYLFSINEQKYFLCTSNSEIKIDSFCYTDIKRLRTVNPKHLAFAGITAFQLYNWYKNNRYCGKCGRNLSHNSNERQLYCENCGNIIYPHIAPAIIVGIINENKILLTKYKDRDYKEYALIAGFTEIGESIEETVKREVMEEVGLKVKGITFYKSQPWAFSDTLLVGFWAYVDGNTNITLDNNELGEAKWFSADEITLQEDDVSLTREMILYFKNNFENLQ